jgi:ABC-type Fe3+ transport system permease subunit
MKKSVLIVVFFSIAFVLFEVKCENFFDNSFDYLTELDKEDGGWRMLGFFVFILLFGVFSTFLGVFAAFINSKKSFNEWLVERIYPEFRKIFLMTIFSATIIGVIVLACRFYYLHFIKIV